jgi:hypothetical protein
MTGGVQTLRGPRPAASSDQDPHRQNTTHHPGETAMTATVTTSEERAERLEAAVGEIAAAVEHLASGEDWRQWLDLSARLTRRHPYSPRKTIWLWEQAIKRGGELSTLGGYRWWQNIGRQVRKGEQAYKVLAPVTRRLPDPDDPTRRVPTIIGWRIESVFDLAQTDGDTLPELPPVIMPTGDSPQGVWDALAGLLTAFEPTHVDCTVGTLRSPPILTVPARRKGGACATSRRQARRRSTSTASRVSKRYGSSWKPLTRL